MVKTPIVMYGVDADPTARAVLSAMFAEEYSVHLFESAETCLASLSSGFPDVILVDALLPGLSGYDFCKQIKTTPRYAHIPIVFVSGDDNLDSRLRGYDAGCDDFILKPYAIDEVRRRVSALSGFIRVAADLRRKIDSSEKLSRMLLSNIDEYEILVRLMKALNRSDDVESVGESVLNSLGGFGLQGAVQIRTGGGQVTFGSQGRDRPLEVSVINQVRDLGRLFEFKRRSVFNFEKLTVLVNNMPTEDQDLCLYLRDHINVAAEMASTKLDSMISTNRLVMTQEGVSEVLTAIRRTIRSCGDKRRTTRAQSDAVMRDLLDQLMVVFTGLGLSFSQEEQIQDMVIGKIRTLLSSYDTGDESTAMLEYLGSRLEKMLLN